MKVWYTSGAQMPSVPIKRVSFKSVSALAGIDIDGNVVA